MTEVEQEKQLGLGAIMMTINRGKVSCNSSLTIFWSIAHKLHALKILGIAMQLSMWWIIF